jgi:hypothetical protein
MSNTVTIGFSLIGLIVGGIILAYVFDWLDDHIL